MYGLYLYCRAEPQKCIMENRLSCKIHDIKKKNVSNASSFKTFFFIFQGLFLVCWQQQWLLFIGSYKRDFSPQSIVLRSMTTTIHWPFFLAQICRENMVCHIPGVPTCFEHDFSKRFLNVTKERKISWKFVYILAKQCGSPFNLTNFLTKKNSEIWDFSLHLKLVGTPCSKYIPDGWVSSGVVAHEDGCQAEVK